MKTRTKSYVRLVDERPVPPESGVEGALLRALAALLDASASTVGDYRAHKEGRELVDALVAIRNRRTQVVITVEGGIIQAVDVENPEELEVFVVDFDTDEADPEALFTVDGGTALVYPVIPTPIEESAQRWLNAWTRKAEEDENRD